MPKTKFQDFIYTLIMVIVMVYAMVCYNVAINMGSLNNTVFLLALKELPIMGVIAFLLEFFLIGKLSQKLAFRLVNPKEDKYISYEDASQFYRDMKDEMNITFLSLDSNQHRIKEDSFKRILDFFI